MTKEELDQQIRGEYEVLEVEEYSDFVSYLGIRKLEKEIQIFKTIIRKDKRTKNNWIQGYTELVTFPKKYVCFLNN